MFGSHCHHESHPSYTSIPKALSCSESAGVFIVCASSRTSWGERQPQRPPGTPLSPNWSVLFVASALYTAEILLLLHVDRWIHTTVKVDIKFTDQLFNDHHVGFTYQLVSHDDSFFFASPLLFRQRTSCLCRCCNGAIPAPFLAVGERNQ